MTDPAWEGAIIMAAGKKQGEIRRDFILNVAKVNPQLAIKCCKSIWDGSTDSILIEVEAIIKQAKAVEAGIKFHNQVNSIY